jgi:hypothetical protein
MSSETVLSAPLSAMSSRRLLAYAAHRKYVINMDDESFCSGAELFSTQALL